MVNLQDRMASVGSLDTEEENLKNLRRKLIACETLKEKAACYDENVEAFKRVCAYSGFLRILHCQDGIRRDTNTTMGSGKRAAVVHSLIANRDAFVEKDGEWQYASDKAQQLANTLGTIFGCGFLGEITCLKSDTVITRSNSFASGVGIVQEVHAVDASALFRRSVECASCSAELQGFEGGIDDSERIPKQAPDTVKLIQWPNVYRSHRPSFMRNMLKRRGIPTSDSRGKGFHSMGINAVQLVLCTKTMRKGYLCNM